jgi:hypothetical protein
MKKILALVLFSVLALSSCDGNSEDLPNSSTADKIISNNNGTNGQLIPIDSSNVSMAGYDEETKVMTVKFLSGGYYEYYEVPLNLWVDFLAAQPHPWSSVGYPRLVGQHYRYNRIS